MRAPIHSVKHYIQNTLTTTTVGTRDNIVYVNAVASADVTTPDEVVEGAIVKAIFVELWAIGSTADQFFTAALVKLPGGLGTMTFAEMANINDWPNKKNILYVTQGLASNDGIAAPIPLIRQWFKIPKGKQRFGLGDTLQLQIASRGDASITHCGFATYKEYT